MNLLVTNHAQVLACIARAPSVRLREVAENVGLTERAVQRLVGELEAAGFLRRVREGRRNRYQVAAEPLRKLARSLEALAGHAEDETQVGGDGLADGPLAGEQNEATAEASDAPLGPPVNPVQGDGIARNLSFVD